MFLLWYKPLCQHGSCYDNFRIGFPASSTQPILNTGTRESLCRCKTSNLIPLLKTFHGIKGKLGLLYYQVKPNEFLVPEDHKQTMSITCSVLLCGSMTFQQTSLATETQRCSLLCSCICVFWNKQFLCSSDCGSENGKLMWALLCFFSLHNANQFHSLLQP